MINSSPPLDHTPPPTTTPPTNPALTPSTLPVHNPTPSPWQTSHSTPFANLRTTPSLPSSTPILIIGSGISSVFAARTLLHTTCSNILVLEARTLCSGATGRNGGHLQPLIHEVADRPDVLDFELRNFGFLASLIEGENIDCDFRRLEGVMSFRSQGSFDEAKADLSQLPARLAHLVEVVEDKKRLAELNLLGNPVGAIIQSTAASLSPYKLVTSLWASLLKEYPERLNIQCNAPATNIAPGASGGEWAVSTPRGNISAPQILLATNGYTSALLPQFTGLIAPVRNGMMSIHAEGMLGRSYAFFLETKDGRSVADHVMQTPGYRREGGENETKSHLMFGGGRAFAPNNAAGVSDDSLLDPQVEEYLRSALPEMLHLSQPQVNTQSPAKPRPTTTAWSGITGYSRDTRPWVGGIPSMPGIWLCGGYSGHGMPLASGRGAHVAELMSAYECGEDWQVLERENIRIGKLPEGYQISNERMAKAKEMAVAGLGGRV